MAHLLLLWLFAVLFFGRLLMWVRNAEGGRLGSRELPIVIQGRRFVGVQLCDFHKSFG